MSRELANVLAILAVLFDAVPLCIGILRYVYLNGIQNNIFILVVASIVTELIAIIVYEGFNLSNLFLLHLFTIVEFALIIWIYKSELKNIMTKAVSLAMITIFVVFALYCGIVVEGLGQFNSYARALESLVVIILSILYFHKILSELKIKRLEKEPMFWLNTGFLIYFSASLFIFIFSNVIQPSLTLSFTYWGIHAILTIVKNSFFAVTLWIRPSIRMSNPS